MEEKEWQAAMRDVQGSAQRVGALKLLHHLVKADLFPVDAYDGIKAWIDLRLEEFNWE